MAGSGAAVSSGILAVSGVISDFGGGYSLTKAGAGWLTLTGANTYSGGTILSAGILNIGTSDAALGSGALTVTGNSSLNTANGGGARNLANAVVLSSGTLTLNSGYANLTLSGNISGAGNIAQASNGNVFFSGINTNTGTITVGEPTRTTLFQFAKTASLYNSDTSKWLKTNIIVKKGATWGSTWVDQTNSPPAMSPPC